MDVISFMETVPLAEFRLLSLQQQSQMADGYFSEKDPWAMDQLRQRGWKWMALCGGTVVSGGPGLSDLPDADQLKRIQDDHDRKAFVFTLFAKEDTKPYIVLTSVA